MAGISIFCGSYTGRDESGSAIEGVLSALRQMADNSAMAAIERIEADLMLASTFILIPPADAAVLLPVVHRYRDLLQRNLGDATRDVSALIRYDEDVVGLDPLDAKSGKGQGWQFYCVEDLARAFAVAGAEGRHVVLSW